MSWILSAFADEAAEEIEQQIAVLRRVGIDHIDLRDVGGTNIAELPADRAQDVKRQFDAAGIQVNMFGSPIGKIDIADDFEVDMQRLRHLGRMSEVFGTKRVRIFSYYNKQGAEAQAWQHTAVERLRRLCDHASELGLVLYHENERGIFGEGLAEVCVLRDAMERDHAHCFRLIFDFDNFNQSGDDPWFNWLELRGGVGAIHLKESKRQSDGSFAHVPVGQGDGQVLRIVQDAATHRWEGPLTLEPHLKHSRAVRATGHSGQMSEEYMELSAEQCFEIAAQAARKMLGSIG